MRPRVATVVTARPWEARLVDSARRSALIRIVRRVCEPSELRTSLDVVVLGSETAWTSAAQIRSIQAGGSRVVGIYPQGDLPGRELLRDADLVLPDTTSPERLVRSIAAFPSRDPAATGGRLIAVTGPRGAPGRTEVAIALARLIARQTRVALLDLDEEAPSIALKVGLPPSPNAAEVARNLRTSGELVSFEVAGNLSVCGGSLPAFRPDERDMSLAILIDAARSAFPVVVADIGVSRPDAALTEISDDVVLVCRHDPLSLIRARVATRDWNGPTPHVVLNQIKPGCDPEEARRSVRRSLGLEPAALIELADPLEAGRSLSGSLSELTDQLLASRCVPGARDVGPY